jgi:hypothetical protein
VCTRAADVPALNGDETLGLQDAEGLADGRLANAELAQEGLLARQEIAVLEHASENLVAERLGDELSDRRLPDLPARGGLCLNLRDD